MTKFDPWLPLLSAWQCVRHPLETARAVRRYCAKRESELHALEQRTAKLERDLAEAEAENQALRAARQMHGFLLRTPPGWH